MQQDTFARFKFYLITCVKGSTSMKKLLIASVIAVLSMSLSPIASASSLAQSLCEYVSVDDKKRFRSYLKNNKLKVRAIFDGVQCNGQNLLEFASNHNAVKTGSMMISKLPKSQVQGVMASLTSAELKAAATKRVSS